MIHLGSLYCAFARRTQVLPEEGKLPRDLLVRIFRIVFDLPETVAAAREMERKYPGAVVCRRARRPGLGTRERTWSRTQNISFQRRGNANKQILRPKFTIDKRDVLLPPLRTRSSTVEEIKNKWYSKLVMFRIFSLKYTTLREYNNI